MQISIDTKVAFSELEKSIYEALRTYSNVHRGSGYKSQVTTTAYEESRKVVLNYLKLPPTKYLVVFCTPYKASLLIDTLQEDDYKEINNQHTGLKLGVVAFTIKKTALRKITPVHVGGGSAKLMAKNWVIWAKNPDKFEAGTPQIINVIALAKALKLMQTYGENIFKDDIAEQKSIDELFSDKLNKYTGTELLEELRKTIIGNDITVDTNKGKDNYLNLDNSASTPAFKPVWDTFKAILKQPEHQQITAIKEAEKICMRFFNAQTDSYDIFFTANTTEGINIVAKNISRNIKTEHEAVILSSLAEHSSNDLPWRKVKNHLVARIGITPEGAIDLMELEHVLQNFNEKNEYGNKRIKLVAINGASNVLGFCNDIKAIASIAHRYGAKIMIDAAQLAPHRKIDIEGCDIDYLVLSGHKIYAPFGSGIVIARKELLNYPSNKMDAIKESGYANPAGIAALAKSLSLLERVGMNIVSKEELALTKKLLKGLSVIPNAKVYGITDTASEKFNRKLGVIPFLLDKKMANRIAKDLSNQNGIGIRYGCHCAHILVKHILGVSPGLEKFQKIMLTLLPVIQLPGVARISLGIENTEKDIERTIDALHQLALQYNSKSSSIEDQKSRNIAAPALTLTT